MMRLPRLTNKRPAGDTTITFGGYNHTEGVGKGEFYDMQNLTSDCFPLLAPRKPRGTERELTKANGLFAREKLLWVDGTEVFYDGVCVGEAADSKKQFISMGARVLIFPDKLYYNVDNGEFGTLENEFTSGGVVTYEQTFLTETELDGEGQVYIKISANGINKGFEKYDGVTLSGFKIEELNKTAVIQDIGEDYIKIIAAIDKDGSQTGSITVARTLPDMDYFAVDNNRLWGCSSAKHEIYASKIGSPFNFHCFEGLATDSYAATIATDGDFTGAVSYLGYIMFFKENMFYRVHGTKPSNFQIMDGTARGVEAGSSGSIQIVNEVLFYKSRDGVMSFQGSMPSDVGAALGEVRYTKGSGGRCGNKYYLSVEDTDGVGHLFVYDTTRGMWHKEDSIEGEYFTQLDGVLYFLAGNTIKKTEGDDEEIIEWFAETGDLTYGMPESKFISRVSLRCEVAFGAALEVWISYDSSEAWERLSSIGGGRAARKGLVNVPMIPKRNDHFRMKFSGYGEVKLFDMTLYLSTGSTERR